MATNWTCFKNQHPLTKQFYLRTVGQMVKCNNINDLENILFATFIVAFSDTEGVDREGNDTVCEKQKNWLKRRIGTGSIDDNDQHQEEVTAEEQIEEILHCNKFYLWTKDIVGKSQKIAEKETNIGNRGNQQCLSKFVDEILKISGTIPLWTAIMQQYYPKAPLIASSTAVESNFNNIKHVMFRNVELPIRVDEFVQRHIKAIDGTAKLIESSLNMNKKDIENTVNNTYKNLIL